MAKVTPELLARCLADLEGGRVTLQECLDAHPGEAAELREMLEVALTVQLLPPVRPSEAFQRQGRAVLVEAISADNDLAIASRLQRLWRQLTDGWGQPRKYVLGRRGMPALILALVLALTAATGGGVVLASQGALPGDALYQVKTTLEELQLTHVTSDEGKAHTYLELAAKRLDEVERANQNGRADAASAAAEAFRQNLTQAGDYLDRASVAGKDVSGLAELLSQNLARQQAALAAAKDEASPQAQDALDKAADVASKGLTLAGDVIQGTPPTELPEVTPTRAIPDSAKPAAVPTGKPSSVPAASKDDKAGAEKADPLSIAEQTTALVDAARSGNVEAVQNEADQLVAAIHSELAQLELAHGTVRQSLAEQFQGTLLGIQARIQELLNYAPDEARPALEKVLEKVGLGLTQAEAMQVQPTPESLQAVPTEPPYPAETGTPTTDQLEPVQPGETAIPTPVADEADPVAPQPEGTPAPVPTTNPITDGDDLPIQPPTAPTGGR